MGDWWRVCLLTLNQTPKLGLHKGRKAGSMTDPPSPPPPRPPRKNQPNSKAKRLHGYRIIPLRWVWRWRHCARDHLHGHTATSRWQRAQQRRRQRSARREEWPHQQRLPPQRKRCHCRRVRESWRWLSPTRRRRPPSRISGRATSCATQKATQVPSPLLIVPRRWR